MDDSEVIIEVADSYGKLRDRIDDLEMDLESTRSELAEVKRVLHTLVKMFVDE